MLLNYSLLPKRIRKVRLGAARDPSGHLPALPHGAQAAGLSRSTRTSRLASFPLGENGVVFSDSFVLAEVAALGYFGFSVRSPFPRQEPSMTTGQEMPQNSHPYGACFQNFLPFLVRFHSFHFLYSSWNCDENYSDFIG